MAPLPQNNTRRYWLDYSVGGVQHSAMIRTSGGLSPSAFGTSMNAVLNTISSLLYLVTITGVRTAAAGSNVSLPVTTGIEGNTYGYAAPINSAIPSFMHFVGRSAGGRRGGFTLFAFNTTDLSFRLTGAENTAVANTVALLNTTDGFCVGIDGLELNFYNYVDTGWNAYWQRKRRS